MVNKIQMKNKNQFLISFSFLLPLTANIKQTKAPITMQKIIKPFAYSGKALIEL